MQRHRKMAAPLSMETLNENNATFDYYECHAMCAVDVLCFIDKFYTRVTLMKSLFCGQGCSATIVAYINRLLSVYLVIS